MPQSGLALPATTPPASLEAHESIQAKDDKECPSQTLSTSCNETTYDVWSESATAGAPSDDHPVHRHANDEGDAEEKINVVSVAKTEYAYVDCTCIDYSSVIGRCLHLPIT